jgi:hypothetical protein
MGSDVETHLIPTIGGVRLAEVTNRHLTAMFSELAATPHPDRLPQIRRHAAAGARHAARRL